LAEEIIKSPMTEGDIIEVNFEKEKEEIRIKINKPKNPKQGKTKKEEN
jgi:hypothetical protein